jgi:hypothetical protein
LLERLADNVGWHFLQQIGETLNDSEAEALLAPHYERKGGVPSSHEFFLQQVDRNVEEHTTLDTVQAGLWYMLDTGLDALSFGGKASIDRAHEARDAGLISEDGFWAQANKSMGRTAAVSVAAALTGGAAGSFSEGAALALGAGEGGAAVIGGAIGGAIGNVGGRFTGDAYDQLLDGKQGFDSFATYARDFASGGLFGAALAPVGLYGAKHLPASVRTMAQTYAVHHPHMIPMLEASRAAGAGAVFRVRMTVREWLDVIGKGMGGPGGMNGFGGLQPAVSAVGGHAAGSAIDAAALSPDLHALPLDAQLLITARPTVDLDAPMARLDEEAPWFEVDSIDDAAVQEPREKHDLGEGPDVDSLELKSAPPTTRAPAESPDTGWWEGERANSAFHSYDPGVLAATEGRPIVFRDGYPDLRPFARGRVFVLKAELRGIRADNQIADQIFARKMGWTSNGRPNATQARQYRTRQRLVWHHVEASGDAMPSELLLVPERLHTRLAHEGGASQARAMHEKLQIGGER